MFAPFKPKHERETSMFKSFIVIAALAASNVALAAPVHLTDGQFLAASRCRALIASPALGGGDTRVIDGLIKTEGRSRAAYIFDKSRETQEDAAGQARHAGPIGRTALIAERDGACQAYNGQPTLTAGATPAAPTTN